MDDVVLYSIIGGILFLFIIIIVLLIFKKKKKKIKHINIDEEYINNLIEKFGNYDNIDTINVDGNKLKVSVKNLKLCDLEGIKKMSSSGVFVTGNNIKSLFKYDAKDLKNELENYKKGLN